MISLTYQRASLAYTHGAQLAASPFHTLLGGAALSIRESLTGEGTGNITLSRPRSRSGEAFAVNSIQLWSADMLMMGLTKKQRKCFDFIQARHQETGVPPSYDEIKDHLGLRSKSGIARLINSLEQRGVISRIPGRARALVPTDFGSIEITLPAELEQRLRLVAATSGKTPEGVIVGMIRDRLAIPSDRIGN